MSLSHCVRLIAWRSNSRFRDVGMSLVLLLWFLPAGECRSEAKVGGNIAPDGREIQVDLPSRFHLKNRGGSDGAGLCVFASLKHASIWQNVSATENIFEYMFSRPGGGWPEKVDKMIDSLCKEKGFKKPEYIQYQGRDLSLLKTALKSGRMACITYNYSPTGRYGGSRIAHMVNCCHLDDKWAGILDNNFPGSIEWMDLDTFVKVWTGGRGNGWAIVFLDPGPPPPPHNK